MLKALGVNTGYKQTEKIKVLLDGITRRKWNNTSHRKVYYLLQLIRMFHLYSDTCLNQNPV